MTNAVPEWRPLLIGEAVERASAAINSIANDLSERGGREDPEFGGAEGYALFFAYLALETREVRYASRAVMYRADAIAEAEMLGLPSALFWGSHGSRLDGCALVAGVFRAMAVNQVR